jgi:hypothetical protein
MNGPTLRKLFPFALAFAAVTALCGARAMQQNSDAAPPPAQADNGQAGGQRSDGQIEMDVVHALDASDALKNDLITAATIQGQVTLSGTVSSDASRQLAESVAAHVQGVTKVQNNLKVGNVQDAANAANEAIPPQADDENQAEAPSQAAPPAPQDNGQQAPPDQAQQAPPPPARPQYGAPYPPPQYPPQYPYGAPPPSPYAQQQPYGYPPPQPPAPRYTQATGPVTVPQGTLVQVRTAESVESKHAKIGEPVQFTLIQDVAVGGVLAIPRGATLHGVVADARKAGALGGSPELALKLTSLDLGGQNYPIDSDQFKVKGPNKAGETVGNAFGGAILGAIIGGIAGRGEGAAIGAGAGAAAGTAASAATPGPRAWIPAEALVTFHLSTPVTVQPVSQEEAARLAQGLYPGGPNLYRRGPYGYYGYPYGPYGYPPVYYRPYFVSGGYYYWR